MVVGCNMVWPTLLNMVLNLIPHIHTLVWMKHALITQQMLSSKIQDMLWSPRITEQLSKLLLLVNQLLLLLKLIKAHSDYTRVVLLQELPVVQL